MVLLLISGGRDRTVSVLYLVQLVVFHILSNLWFREFLLIQYYCGWTCRMDFPHGRIWVFSLFQRCFSLLPSAYAACCLMYFASIQSFEPSRGGNNKCENTILFIDVNQIQPTSTVSDQSGCLKRIKLKKFDCKFNENNVTSLIGRWIITLASKISDV